ncbi:hypothetical protein [Paenibacillus kandeliae]|uniref:hypothetical protein n=1 Tax=Paenibacillus kandeliae TaxID=3231269 RepID=UPI0034597A55
MKEEKYDTCFVYCNQCEAAWESPLAYQQQQYASFTYDDFREPWSWELEATGWNIYIDKALQPPNRCAVCGHDGLEEAQWENTIPSYEICVCCGFQAGFDDDAASYPRTLEQYRNSWLSHGAVFFSVKKKPEDWDLKKQLATIEVYI